MFKRVMFKNGFQQTNPLLDPRISVAKDRVGPLIQMVPDNWDMHKHLRHSQLEQSNGTLWQLGHSDNFDTQTTGTFKQLGHWQLGQSNGTLWQLGHSDNFGTQTTGTFKQLGHWQLRHRQLGHIDFWNT